MNILSFPRLVLSFSLEPSIAALRNFDFALSNFRAQSGKYIMALNLALELASRQKRLLYWQDRFETDSLPSEDQSRVKDLLKDYAKTITKAATEKDEQARQNLLEELQVMDRKLNTILETRRLLTSKLGIAALTDCSTRGKGS